MKTIRLRDTGERLTLTHERLWFGANAWRAHGPAGQALGATARQAVWLYRCQAVAFAQAIQSCVAELFGRTP